MSQQQTASKEKPQRTPAEVAGAIADALHDAGANLVASLPDNWIAPLIKHLDRDQRFRHVPVNREESAVGLCSGAFFSGTPGVALMGASGFMTCIYAITKINYTYQIPMLFIITLRGAPGDTARYHVSNGLYLQPIIDAINIPSVMIETIEDLPKIGSAFRHASVIGRPYVVGLGRDLLKGVR
jgi:sulfopyruvate decarboxylase subunit alpha